MDNGSWPTKRKWQDEEGVTSIHALKFAGTLARKGDTTESHPMETVEEDPAVPCTSHRSHFDSSNIKISDQNWMKTFLTRHAAQPLIFNDMMNHWDAKTWSPYTLENRLQTREIKFRIGKKTNKSVQLETECQYEWATLSQFNAWLQDSGTEDNPLLQYSHDDYWCYADYKHMPELFDADSLNNKNIDWSPFGFAGRDGHQSTFWLGTSGAYTVGHYDTYGCNLVAQIYGRKRWILFPPEQTANLYPTRVPYEESSVFSDVNVKSPDLNKHPLFKYGTPYIVDLDPGQVLYVPRHWWHFVENMETTVSINTWIEIPEDTEERLKESIARTLAFSIMESESDMTWLNPTESPSDPDENLKYIRRAAENLQTEKCNCGGSEHQSYSKQRISKRTGNQDSLSAKRCRISLRSCNGTLSARCMSECYDKTDGSKESDCKIVTAVEKNLRSLNIFIPEPGNFKALKELFMETWLNSSRVDRQHSEEHSQEPKSDFTLQDHVLTFRDVMDAALQPDVISLICEKLKSNINDR